MDATHLQAGHRLDRYELLCPLAYGGMASVWLARFGVSQGFERFVVIKMILPQFSQDPRFQEMFVDEARIASRVEHGNVARILDVGDRAGSFYIVMEWVDGDSLSKLMQAAEQRKERIPTGVALRICADAAAGLHAAHELKGRDGALLGVVHRDVSPQNLLISNAGSTLLIDFGVAKARDRVSPDTTAGQLKGKIRYMAPEQALGRPIDRRADVWALGSILYEIFGGSPPFEGANEVATLHRLTSGIPPATLPAGTPKAVEEVIRRALSFDPQARFATALELGQALDAIMAKLGEPTSIAVVESYTQQLLADRKAARKRAVEAALEKAAARASGQRSAAAAPPSEIGTRTQIIPSVPPAPVPTAGASAGVPPAAFTATQPMGFGEAPSAPSATPGSTTLDYGSERSRRTAANRPRMLSAFAVGLLLSMGVVGGALVFRTATARRAAAQSGHALVPSSGATEEPTAAPPPATEKPPVETPAANPTEEVRDPPQAAPSSELAPEPEGNGTATAAPRPAAIAKPGRSPAATSPATKGPSPPKTTKPADEEPKDYGF